MLALRLLAIVQHLLVMVDIESTIINGGLIGVVEL